MVYEEINMAKLKLFTIASVVALSLAAFTGAYGSSTWDDSPSGASRKSLRYQRIENLSYHLDAHLNAYFAQYGPSTDGAAELERLCKMMLKALDNEVAYFTMVAYHRSRGEDIASDVSLPTQTALLLSFCEHWAKVYDRHILPSMGDEHPDNFTRASASPTKTNDAPWPPEVIHLATRYGQEVAMCEAQMARIDTPGAWLLKLAQMQSAATCVQYIKTEFLNSLRASILGYISELAVLKDAPANLPTIQRLKQTKAAMEELIGHLMADRSAELEQSLVYSEAENQAEGQSPAKRQRTEAWGYVDDDAN